MSEVVYVSLPGAVGDVGTAPAAGVAGAALDDAHLRACLDEPTDRPLREHADVLYFARAVTPAEVAAQLDAFPGSLVVAGRTADGTVVLAVRGGRRGEDCRVIASALHGLLAAGLCAADPQVG